jgi:hypothetical protein
VTEDDLAVEGRLQHLIGAELLRMAGGAGPGVLLYAEPTEREVQSGVFVGDDNTMDMLTSTTVLNELVRELWRARNRVAPGQGWIAMTFLMLGNEYRVDYIDKTVLDPGPSANERCKAALRRLLGPVKVVDRGF